MPSWAGLWREDGGDIAYSQFSNNRVLEANVSKSSAEYDIDVNISTTPLSLMLSLRCLWRSQTLLEIWKQGLLFLEDLPRRLPDRPQSEQLTNSSGVPVFLFSRSSPRQKSQYGDGDAWKRFSLLINSLEIKSINFC